MAQVIGAGARPQAQTPAVFLPLDSGVYGLGCDVSILLTYPTPFVPQIVSWLGKLPNIIYFLVTPVYPLGHVLSKGKCPSSVPKNPLTFLTGAFRTAFSLGVILLTGCAATR